MVQQHAEVTKFQTRCGLAIEQFLNEVSKSSLNTERSYRGDIRRFLDESYGKTIDTITSEELDLMDFDSFTQYVNSLKGLSNNTINRHVTTCRTLYTHLKIRGVVKLDIGFLELIKPMKDDSTRIEGMTKEVVLNYISEADREVNHGEIKQKLIMFAVDTGLRLEDYLTLQWNQFSPQEEWVILRGYGKGNKPWIEKISFEVYDSLLELRKHQGSDESKVFSPLNTKNVRDMMVRIKQNLGYHDRAFSFHSFKKTAVTFAYRLTGDILEAMKKGKHSNIETTQNYLEEEDYGMTGMFSLGDHDAELYKKITHNELLMVLNSMNKDTLHLLNIKAKNMMK